MAAVLAVAVTAVMAVLAGTADTAYVPLNSLTITSLYTNRTESEADDGSGPSPRVDREDHHRLGLLRSEDYIHYMHLICS